MVTPAHTDRIAENQQLRDQMARAAHLIETGRTDEALTMLRREGRPAPKDHEEPQP